MDTLKQTAVLYGPTKPRIDLRPNRKYVSFCLSDWWIILWNKPQTMRCKKKKVRLMMSRLRIGFGWRVVSAIRSWKYIAKPSGGCQSWEEQTSSAASAASKTATVKHKWSLYRFVFVPGSLLQSTRCLCGPKPELNWAKALRHLPVWTGVKLSGSYVRH